MTDLERLISETIKKNQEIIVSLTLQNEALSTQLPQQKTNQESKGYYVCPKTGERHWFDKKAEARHEKELKRKILTLINKEA
jgi:hypothetical protein